MSQAQVNGMATDGLDATINLSNPPTLYLTETTDKDGHPLTKLIEEDEDGTQLTRQLLE